jgi:ABC-2 type transport system ATP-binding protein
LPASSRGDEAEARARCCLCHAPDLILLDEPTNGVDPVSRREFWKILYDLLTEGVTIVVSTAYLDEAERCNRIALMYGGRFVTSGTPAEVKAGMGKHFIELITTSPVKSEMILKEIEEYRGVILTGQSLRLFVHDRRKAGKRSLRSSAKGDKSPFDQGEVALP